MAHDPAWLMDHMSECFVTVDAAQVVTSLNRAAELQLKRRRDELLGKKIFDVFPSARGSRAAEAYARALREKTELVVEDRFGTAPDESWYEVRACPVGDEVAVFFRAVTESKRTELALSRSETRFSELADSLPEIIFELDTRGRVTRCNSRGLAAFGGSSSSLERGLDAFDRLVPEDRQRARDNVARVLAGQAVGPQEYTALRHDGSTFPCLISSSLIQRDGAAYGTRSVLIDLSERKRQEQERSRLESQIQRAQKLESLGVLAGGIAHDFNNLLVAVLGNADLTLLELPADAPSRTFLEEIKRAAQRASELTAQLLAYTGKSQAVMKPLELNDVVRDAGQLLQSAMSKQATLSWDLGPDLPPVMGDLAQIRQLVMNLVTNATEAVGESEGAVLLRTGTEQLERRALGELAFSAIRSPGLHVFLEVIDTGTGMDPETLSRVFDPFFTTKFPGRGLGLATVQGTVRAHRGGIRIRSARGKGTTFRVLLPAAPTADRRIATSDPRPLSWRGTGTVLIIEDEPIVQNVARRILEHLGFRVLVAGDLGEGLELYRRHSPELAAVLLDATMPKLSCAEMVRELRLARADLPVILTSGFTERQIMAELGDQRVSGFIPKPYRVETFVEQLRRALGT